MPEPTADATMAVFLDLENIAIGAREAKYPRFDIKKILERLLLRGHIVLKKAYCDFSRYNEFKKDLHEAAFELIEIPHVRQSGKNSADIRMVVDALDLCDFSPLVSKLRENAKTVIGMGVKNSSSDLFINNCDDFIYYDDLVRKTPAKKAVRSGTRTAKKKTAAKKTARTASDSSSLTVDRAIDHVMDTLAGLTSERDGGPIWGSMIKQALKRRNPGFDERAHGFRSFNELLQEAEKRGLLTLAADERSGGYTVRVAE
jgi:hypothetical protein